MSEFFTEWGEALSQFGLGGFAVYALVNVWNRLIKQADNHRKNTSERESAHREELKSRDDQHRKEMREVQERHSKEMKDLVQRNMDEHRERNRVQVMLGMSVAEAFTKNGQKVPVPYPDVDDSGKDDPRKK